MTNASARPQKISMVVEGLSSKSISAERARDLMAMSQENFDSALAVVRHMADEQIQQDASRQMSSTIFTVPTNLFGYDRYDAAKMGRRLALSLYNDGFSVQGAPRMFRIIWGKEEEEEKPKRPPLTKEVLMRHEAAVGTRRRT